KSLKQDKLSLVQADQQAVQFFGEHMAKIVIRDVDANVAWLLYVESSEAYINHFPWAWMGDMFSLGFFEEHRSIRQTLGNTDLAFWEFIDLMEKNFEGYQISHSSLFLLDFSPLIKIIQIHRENRF